MTVSLGHARSPWFHDGHHDIISPFTYSRTGHQAQTLEGMARIEASAGSGLRGALLLVMALAGEASIATVGGPRMHALDDIALPALLSAGCVCRIRSAHGGAYLARQQGGGGLELSAVGPSRFWLQAVESEVSQLAERAGSPTSTPCERVACHLVPIDEGSGRSAREYVSLQQDAPTTTSAIAASLMVARVKGQPWLRFEGFSKSTPQTSSGSDGGGRRTLRVGPDGKLEVRTPEEGGNPLQKLVRMIRGSGRRMAFDIEVLESSLVGDVKLGGRAGTWLPRWSACVHALQQGLGMELTLAFCGMGSEPDVFILTSQGVLCNGRDRKAAKPVAYGTFKVRRVLVEPSSRSPSHGLLVAELAAQGASGTASGDKDNEFRRYLVVDEQGQKEDSRCAVRLVRHASTEQAFALSVEGLSLRYSLATWCFASGFVRACLSSYMPPKPKCAGMTPFA
jgi:hypothetical protein